MNLRDELLKVREDNGGVLTPQAVVDAARAPEHPLHHRFEWEDATAGEKWRRHQAHQLIRVVRIPMPTGDPSEPRTLRAFQAVRRDDDVTTVAYEPTEDVAVDPLLSAIVRRDMEREWRQLFRRFEAFQEFREMVLRDLGDEAA